MKKATLFTLKLGAFTVMLASLLLLFKQNGWITTLFLSTAIQFCIGALVLGIVMVYLKKYKHAIYYFIASILLSFQFIGYFFEDDQEIAQFEFNYPKLKIAQFNVLASNKSKKETIQSIIASNATILSIQETNKNWTDSLDKELRHAYPYSIYFPTERCCYGISMLSKVPLMNADITFHGGVPNIEADIYFGNQLTHVISSHTHSPISRSNLLARNQHIADLKKHISKIDSPTIIMGDFNTVPWDDNMIALKETSNLVDSRKSYTSTFPSYLGVGGIPIDYILHSQEIKCTDFKSISIKGSDHRGIIGEYIIN